MSFSPLSHNYWLNLAIAADQLFNALVGGHADETLSARCYRNRWKAYGWWLLYQFINALFFWQHDHCFQSYNAELERKHLPQEYQHGG
jgi:hypothetical protein